MNRDTRHLERIDWAPNPRRPPDTSKWPFTIPAVAQIIEEGGLDIPGGVTFLVGENGSGKSTLVEALAAKYSRKGFATPHVAVTGPGADASPLHSHLKVHVHKHASPAGFFLRAEALHGFLEGVDGDPNQAFAWGDEKMQARSHGESFLAVLKHRFTDVGVYFLDEPEAALSFQSCLGLVSLLDTMRREGSQVIVATHSPLLVSLPGATFFLAPMSERRSAVRPRDMEATLENAAGPRTTPSTSKATLWTARILGGLLILFLLVDAMGKILRLAPYVEGTAKIGFPPGALVPLGLVLLVSTVLYAVPRTAVLGAVLLTGYLGGAIATHVHMGQSFAFPLVFGVIAWACLYVRDARLRALLPLVRS